MSTDLALSREDALMELRRQGFGTAEAFAAWLTTYRGGFLVKTDGMTNSQIAEHAGVGVPAVDAIMANREFRLALREHITRSILSPYEQAHLAQKLLQKTRETTDIRQMVAGMKHLDEMGGLGPEQGDNTTTLVVKFEQDQVTNPYEEVQDPLDAEFIMVEGDESPEGDDERAQEGEALELEGEETDLQPAQARKSAWEPKKTNEIDLGTRSQAAGGGPVSEREAEQRRSAGLGAPSSEEAEVIGWGGEGPFGPDEGD